MQTFDALLPAVHTPSTRNAETKFTSQKPSHDSEQFGAVMDRALTGSSREASQDESGTQVDEKPGAQSGKRSSPANESKHADKSRKPLHRELAKDDAPPEPTAIIHFSTHNPHITNQPALPAEGSAHNNSEEGTNYGKHLAAVGTTTDASALSLSAQFLGLPGAPLPVSVPAPAAQKASGSRSPKGVDAIPNQTLPAAVKTETSKADSKTPAAAGQVGELVKPDSDLKPAEAKTSASLAENHSEKSGIIATKDPAFESLQPPSTKADSINIQTETGSDEQKAQLAQLKASVDHASVTASDPHGTAAAKQHITMQKAEKTQKVAGPAEKDLPGSTATGSEELPTGQKLSIKASLHDSGKLDSAAVTETPASSKISNSVESAAPTITSAAVSPATETDSRIRVLERTHDIVALHAMRLSESGSASLHVVVKPGGGIQLSLELRQTQDGVEVHASLHKGDFEHLRQYWPELQQRLESRGVRVGALTTSENFSSGSQQQFQQPKQQSSNQDPLYAGAFAEFALAGTLSEAPATRAARATAYRGWETWA